MEDFFSEYSWPKHVGDVTTNEGLIYVGIDVGNGNISSIVAETEDEMRTYQEMATADHDRCMVVVGHAMLEDTIKVLLLEFVEDQKFTTKLLNGYIPFMAMVDRAEKECLIEKQTKDMLRKVAIIRNKFAHGYDKRRFSDLAKDDEAQRVVRALAEFVAKEVEFTSIEPVEISNPAKSFPPRAAYIYSFDSLMNTLHNAFAEAIGRTED